MCKDGLRRNNSAGFIMWSCNARIRISQGTSQYYHLILLLSLPLLFLPFLVLRRLLSRLRLVFAFVRTRKNSHLYLAHLPCLHPQRILTSPPTHTNTHTHAHTLTHTHTHTHSLTHTLTRTRTRTRVPMLLLVI